MDNDGLTQYMRIAISVAERIAAGELREGEKISGRSKLSSEYEVSPETVRRAIQLLSDMRVVAVKEQSGVYVLSADNAKRHHKTLENRADPDEQTPETAGTDRGKGGAEPPHGELCQSILEDTLYPVQPAETLPTFSCRVPDGWYGIGKKFGDLRFWQATGATVAAIRRGTTDILFPAPTRELYAGDTVIFVGEKSRGGERFLNTEQETGSGKGP